MTLYGIGFAEGAAAASALAALLYVAWLRPKPPLRDERGRFRRR